MIYDTSFLEKLEAQQCQIIFVKIISLTKDEREIETIEGKVTKGNLNVDGASAIRRTCSLSFVTEKINLSNYLWSLNNKFKLFIGLKNNIDLNYPEIIWFPQGIYIITSFSSSLTQKQYSINISGKDKMCLLNGEVGGIFNSQIDFGNLEVEDFMGEKKDYKLPVKKIIREMLHQYGGEPFQNIIINDLDDSGLELQEYRLSNPLYIWKEKNSQEYNNGTLDSSMTVGVQDEKGSLKAMNIDNLVFDPLFHRESINSGESTIKPTDFYLLNSYQVSFIDGGISENQKKQNILHINSKSSEESKNIVFEQEYNKNEERLVLIPFKQTTEGQKESIDANLISLNDIYSFSIATNIYSDILYQATKINYGDTVGYKETELVYPGKLIANAGETICSVLDKIKKMLVFYEYFYNESGQFVFQKKPQFKEPELLIDNSIISSFSLNPDLKNVKNDYTVWGTRKGINGSEIPIHARKAIQKKPTKYTSITVKDSELENYNKAYGLNVHGQYSTVYSTKDYNWREIIYQMALDYHKYNHLDNFELKISQANPDLFPSGKTGYEQYYIDLQGFWRQLYNPNTLDNSNPRNPEFMYPWFCEENKNSDLSQYVDILSGEIILLEEDKNNPHKDILKLKSDNLNYSLKSETANEDTFIPGTSDLKVSLFNKNNEYVEDNSIQYQKMSNQLFLALVGINTQKEIREDNYENIVTVKKPYNNLYQITQELSKIENKQDYLFSGYFYSNGNNITVSTQEISKTISSNNNWVYVELPFKGSNPKDKKDFIKFSSSSVFSFKNCNIQDLNFQGRGQPDAYWNKEFLKYPENFNFYFDLIDSEGDISTYSVDVIGDRPKVSNNSMIKAILYRDVPWIIFGKPIYEPKTGYRYFNLKGYDDAFSISYQGKSANDEIKQYVNNLSYCQERISLKTIPIYRLKPNSLIYINDLSSGINGKYIASKYSINLDYKSLMNITATKDNQYVY